MRTEQLGGVWLGSRWCRRELHAHTIGMNTQFPRVPSISSRGWVGLRARTHPNNPFPFFPAMDQSIGHDNFPALKMDPARGQIHIFCLNFSASSDSKNVARWPAHSSRYGCGSCSGLRTRAKPASCGRVGTTDQKIQKRWKSSTKSDACQHASRSPGILRTCIRNWRC